MRTPTKPKLYGAVVYSEEVGSDFALVLAANAKEAYDYARERAPKRASIEIVPADEMLWEQYRGFAVLTTDSLYENYPPGEE